MAREGTKTFFSIEKDEQDDTKTLKIGSNRVWLLQFNKYIFQDIPEGNHNLSSSNLSVIIAHSYSPEHILTYLQWVLIHIQLVHLSIKLSCMLDNQI